MLLTFTACREALEPRRHDLKWSTTHETSARNWAEYLASRVVGPDVFHDLSCVVP